MSRPTERGAPAAAPRLTRQRVLEAAVRIADGQGIATLSMRRLAQELDAGVMSLYYHVPNKEQLLTAMVDRVVAEIELPPADQPWKLALKRTALSTHEVLVRHPWATALLLSGAGASQARMRHMDAILGCLRAAGFSAELTDHAYHALDSHVLGFTLWLVGISAGLEQLGDVRNAYDLFDAETLPHLAEHIGQHLRERSAGEPGEFEFGLDLILDGLEGKRDSG